MSVNMIYNNHLFSVANSALKRRQQFENQLDKIDKLLQRIKKELEKVEEVAIQLVMAKANQAISGVQQIIGQQQHENQIGMMILLFYCK